MQRSQPDEDGSVDPDEYQLCYFDDITDDGCEDGFAVLSCLHADLHSFRKANPHVARIFLASDGAGCYSGKYTSMTLPLLSEWTGLCIHDHSLGEAGMNKSSLDGHFGTAGQHTKRVVASGQQDATSAETTCAAALRNGGMKNTTCRVVNIRRENQAKVKAGALSKLGKGAGVKNLAYRQFVYDEDGRWIGTRFFKHKGFGDGLFLSRGEIEKGWVDGAPQGPTGVLVTEVTLKEPIEKNNYTTTTWPVPDDPSGSVGSQVDSNTPPEHARDSPAPLGPARPGTKADRDRQKREERKRKRQEREEERLQHLKRLKESSNGIWCPEKGCNRFFRYAALPMPCRCATKT